MKNKEFTFDDIKSGMILEDENKNHYIVFETNVGLAWAIYGKKQWDNLKKDWFIDNIVLVKDKSDGEHSLNWGKIIWQKHQTVELSLQEIADKFGIDVKNIKIVEK